MPIATLDSLAALEKAATRAPWFVRELNDDVCMSAIGIATSPDDDPIDVAGMSDWSNVIAACLVQSPDYVVPADGRWSENAALIAAMRNALPELLRLARIGLRTEATQG